MRTCFVFGFVFLAGTSSAGIVGQWDFSGDFGGRIGPAVAFNLGTGPTPFESTVLGGISAQVARVLPSTTLSAGTDDLHMIVPTSVGGNRGGAFLHQYSGIMDVLVPSASYRGSSDGFTSPVRLLRPTPTAAGIPGPGQGNPLAWWAQA